MPLFKRRIKSALYIDFENVKFSAAALTNVVAWLEDGLFDEAKRRRMFLQRRVYMNSQASKHRKSFEAIGFEVIEVEKYGGLHNGADIRIAVDMIEAVLQQTRIDEYILFSLDSDFVPLIQKLGARGKRTVMLVDEHKSVAKTAFDLHADVTVARRIVEAEGESYVRPKRGLFGRIKRPKPTPSVDSVAAIPAPSNGGPQLSNGGPTPRAPVETRPASPVPAPAKGPLPRPIVDAFVKIASRNVGQPTARTAIMKELATLPGFAHTGHNAYFGLKSYKALAMTVAALEPRIRVKPLSFGGVAVTYAVDPQPASHGAGVATGDAAP